MISNIDEATIRNIIRDEITRHERAYGALAINERILKRLETIAELVAQLAKASA